MTTTTTVRNDLILTDMDSIYEYTEVYNKIFDRAVEKGIVYSDSDYTYRYHEATHSEWTLDRIALWKEFEKEGEIIGPFNDMIPSECRQSHPGEDSYIEGREHFFATTVEDLCSDFVGYYVEKTNCAVDPRGRTVEGVDNVPLIILHKDTVTEACIIPTLIPALS